LWHISAIYAKLNDAKKRIPICHLAGWQLFLTPSYPDKYNLLERQTRGSDLAFERLTLLLACHLVLFLFEEPTPKVSCLLQPSTRARVGFVGHTTYIYLCTALYANLRTIVCKISNATRCTGMRTRLWGTLKANLIFHAVGNNKRGCSHFSHYKFHSELAGMACKYLKSSPRLASDGREPLWQS